MLRPLVLDRASPPFVFLMIEHFLISQRGKYAVARLGRGPVLGAADPAAPAWVFSPPTEPRLVPHPLTAPLLVLAALLLLADVAVRRLTKKIGKAHGHDDSEHIPAQDQTAFRALAARANFLALDKPDIAYAVKEIARRMSDPRQSDSTVKEAPRAVCRVPASASERPDCCILCTGGIWSNRSTWSHTGTSPSKADRISTS